VPDKPAPKNRDPFARFLRFVSCDSYFSGECWIWKGGLTKGYGHFWFAGKTTKAHRWFWEQASGPVPKGYHLDHLCKNPRCVNPAHLELVTVRENILRGIGPAALNAKATQCHNGHQFTPENTYIHNGSRSCRKCRALAMRSYRSRMENKSGEFGSISFRNRFCSSFAYQ
jgi:hypothetical protein